MRWGGRVCRSFADESFGMCRGKTAESCAGGCSRLRHHSSRAQLRRKQLSCVQDSHYSCGFLLVGALLCLNCSACCRCCLQHSDGPTVGCSWCCQIVEGWRDVFSRVWQLPIANSEAVKLFQLAPSSCRALRFAFLLFKTKHTFDMTDT